MRILYIPTIDPLYEIIIIEYEIGSRYQAEKVYNFTYQKRWPCEDGIYEPPKYDFPITKFVYLLQYLHMLAGPEIATEVSSKLGHNT